MAAKKKINNVKLTQMIWYEQHSRYYDSGVVLTLSASERERLVDMGVAKETTESVTVFETAPPDPVKAGVSKPVSLIKKKQKKQKQEVKKDGDTDKS